MSAGAMAYLAGSSTCHPHSTSGSLSTILMPLYSHRDQRLLFMRFPHGKILAPQAKGTAVQTVLLKPPIFVRLYASNFSRDGRAVLSLAKDSGIIV